MSEQQPATSAADPNEQIKQLQKHFSSISTEPKDQITGWDNAWKNSITPWDRGRPNPALIDTLHDKSSLTTPCFRDAARQHRKKALVPGCGRGVDVLLLASHGFDAYGLDASESAMAAARDLASSVASEPSSEYYSVKDANNGSGAAHFIAGNFFADEFLSQTHSKTDAEGFDLIYDYTFLCALPPALRPRWARRMASLLAEGGRLICVEHPLAKDPLSGGPPYGLSGELYEELFHRPGEEVKYGEDGYVVSGGKEEERSADALLRVERWKAERGFTQTVENYVSIWKRER